MNSAISANTQAIQDIESDISTHTSNTTIHITSTERATWNGKQDALTFDSAPTANSANVLASGTIKAALDQKQESLTFDQVPTANSQNVLSSGAIHIALSGKVNTSDTIAIDHGGTGATTAAGARTNLGLGTAAQKDATSSVASDNDDLVTSGAVFSKLAEYQEALTFDSTPTANSENPVTSRGIKTALDAKQDALTFDSVPTKNSSNVVSSGAIRAALDEKQDIMTLDPSPQQDSTNAVMSGGVFAALQGHTYTLPQASASVLGGIKVGSNLSIDENGVLSAIAEPYSLPTASSSVLGGIKVGSNLTILNGVLSAQSIDIPNGNHATIETSSTASKAYAVGDFLVLKSTGLLYKVTQAISANGTITVGTNVSQTTDGAQIAAINARLNYAGAGAHNCIYRGKNLGTSVTSAQWSAISSGTFQDLYIGDYWVINGVTWRIAAFDYWLNCGDANCTTHHVVIVPDSALVSGQMNKTNITTGAYIGSDFYTGNNGNTSKTQAYNKVKAAFSESHILSHREHLQNSVSGNYENGGTWYDSTMQLMSEIMVYGHNIFHGSAMNNGTSIPNHYVIDKTQLPLFAMQPSRICNRGYWWLRDVVSSTVFAYVSNSGYARYDGASNSLGIRPAFGIK